MAQDEPAATAASGLEKSAAAEEFELQSAHEQDLGVEEGRIVSGAYPSVKVKFVHRMKVTRNLPMSFIRLALTMIEKSGD